MSEFIFIQRLPLSHLLESTCLLHIYHKTSVLLSASEYRRTTFAGEEVVLDNHGLECHIVMRLCKIQYITDQIVTISCQHAKNNPNVTKYPDSGVSLSCPILAPHLVVWPWIKCVHSLHFSFLVCRVGGTRSTYHIERMWD